MARAMDVIEIAGLRYLDPGRARFFKSGALTRLTVEGERSWLDVSVLRAFPLSSPSRHLCVRDGAGSEIGLILDPDALDGASRAVVLAELARRYVTPVIRRVVSAQERCGTVEWVVETSRGAARFATQNLREHVLRVEPGHYLVTDVEDNRYEIVDLESLDPRTRWLVESHV